MAIGSIVTRSFVDLRLEGLAKDDLLRRALTGDPEATRKNAQNECGPSSQIEFDFATTDATANEVVGTIGFSATPVAGQFDFSQAVGRLVKVENFHSQAGVRSYQSFYATVLGNAATPVVTNGSLQNTVGTTLGGMNLFVTGGTVILRVTGIAATAITHRVKITVYDATL